MLKSHTDARGEFGAFVTATVTAPWARARSAGCTRSGEEPGLADPHEQNPFQRLMRMVDRTARGRHQPGGQTQTRLYEVLGVQRRMIGRAAGQEQHKSGPTVINRRGDARYLRASIGQNAAIDGGLLGDLRRHSAAEGRTLASLQDRHALAGSGSWAGWVCSPS